MSQIITRTFTDFSTDPDILSDLIQTTPWIRIRRYEWIGSNKDDRRIRQTMNSSVTGWATSCDWLLVNLGWGFIGCPSCNSPPPDPPPPPPTGDSGMPKYRSFSELSLHIYLYMFRYVDYKSCICVKLNILSQAWTYFLRTCCTSVKLPLIIELTTGIFMFCFVGAFG